ncbi:universal stress protein [Kitasatospora sp. NPDC058965]|uniref:universal stress protein n=1 Tax=Kitasatospora sp. NPDC058965 TaxID=3346682 RepID=UPI0036AD82DD
MTTSAVRRPVVLGVDADRPSLPALAWAADEADRRGLPLRLLHCAPPLLGDLSGSGRHALLVQRGQEALDRAAVFVRERRPGVELTVAQEEDYPDWCLVEQSKEASMVVLGSRHLGRMAQLAGGHSVVLPVSAQAPCPVVVVGAPEHVEQQPPYVVVGVDGSATCRSAIDFAFDLAAERHAALRAVWVLEAPHFGPRDPAGAERECRRRLAEVTAGRRSTHPDVELTHEVLHGHPVEELAEAATHALAVVVGRRGRGGYTGMRLGSVPHGLLHRARCPVVTVPGS